MGVHLNAATMGFIPFGPPSPDDLAALTPAELARLERLQASTGGPGNGYFEIQAQRPQTLAYGLTDSPAGSSPGSSKSSRSGASGRGCQTRCSAGTGC